MNALELAAQHVLRIQAEQPATPADTFARELLDTQRRLEQALASQRSLVHRTEQAEDRARRAESRAGERIWPIAVRCDGPRCASALAFDPLPEETALATVLFDLRWRTTTDGKHLCPRCQR